MLNFKNQVGKNYVIYDEDMGKRTNDILEKHYIEDMGDISRAIITPQNAIVKIPINKKFKTYFDNALKYDEYDPNKVILKEEIETMPKQELKDKVDYYMHQASKGLVMTKEEAKSKLMRGELIWVNGYVRADGTKVRGYYRAKPHY